MKIDILFPPPPLHNQKPLPCSDLTPARLRALARLSAIATVAESFIGSIQLTAADAPPLFPATSRGFVLHCFQGSPFAGELQELLARSKINIIANDHVDAPHVMVIDVRKYWGVLGPIRGDIVLFADGQAAIVTQALCMGCQHFEAVSLTLDAAPQIVKLQQWTSTVRWILRLVDESEETTVVEATTVPAEAAATADTPPSTETAPPAEAPQGKRKRA